MDPVSELKIIARIRSDFPSKFGIPRQSGLVEELKAELVFEPEYRNPEALRGIEGFSHIWLIWLFSEAVRASWSPTVRPPRLGGNTRMGVFATRSPFRPNPIGLSAVRLDGIRRDETLGQVLLVSGADLMDGTPILDIKPYLPFADSYPQASGGDHPQSGPSASDLPASKWKFRNHCWRKCQRSTDRRCWVCWRRIRGRRIIPIPREFTAWNLPGSR